MSKKLFDSLWEKPDLRVYLRAAKDISNIKHRYCCFAICDAITELHPTLSENRLISLVDMYCEQFRRACYQRALGKPIWWSSICLHTEDRVEALHAFVKECKRLGKQGY